MYQYKKKLTELQDEIQKINKEWMSRTCESLHQKLHTAEHTEDGKIVIKNTDKAIDTRLMDVEQAEDSKKLKSDVKSPKNLEMNQEDSDNKVKSLQNNVLMS